MGTDLTSADGIDTIRGVILLLATA